MPKKNIQADKKRTAKPVGYRFRGKSKAKPTNAEIKKGKKNGNVYYENRPNRSDVSKKTKLENGGSLQSAKYRLVNFDVCGNEIDGYYVSNKLQTETIIDIPQNTSKEQAIAILKSNKVLSDKANEKNIDIYGEDGVRLFFSDEEKSIPLFELVCVEKYQSGGAVKSELIFTNPINTVVQQQSIAPISTESASVTSSNDVSIDDKGNIKLPDYDMKPDDMLEKHMIDGEIYIEHLRGILGRSPRHEEVVGSVLLRKCFLKPYYKKVNYVNQ